MNPHPSERKKHRKSADGSYRLNDHPTQAAEIAPNRRSTQNKRSLIEENKCPPTAAHAIDNNLSAPRGVEPRYRDYETRLDRRSDISPTEKGTKAVGVFRHAVALSDALKGMKSITISFIICSCSLLYLPASISRIPLSPFSSIAST